MYKAFHFKTACELVEYLNKNNIKRKNIVYFQYADYDGLIVCEEPEEEEQIDLPLKTFPMTLEEHYSDDKCGIDSQRLKWDYQDNKGSFFVSDFTFSPEDAIIGRELFDAYDYKDAVELGMKLGREGFYKIALSNS